MQSTPLPPACGEDYFADAAIAIRWKWLLGKAALVSMGLVLFLLIWPDTCALHSEKMPGLELQPYLFRANNGEQVHAELGRLQVPENRSKPARHKIELAFVRFKSTSASPGPPIVFLAGGPGGSGIHFAKGDYFPLFMAMRSLGDVIALDQRGTGISQPSLACSQSLDFSPDELPTRDAVLKQARKQARRCKQFWHRKGVDLNAYNTNESADDVDSLRAALEYKQVNLWGVSYGSHLAFATMRRHEKSIARTIVGAAEGLDQTYKLPSNIQASMEDLDGRVKADERLRNSVPDFLGLVKRVLDRVQQNPPTVTTRDAKTQRNVNVKLTRFVLQYLTATSLGRPRVSELPAAYHAMDHGDFSYFARLWLNETREPIHSAMGFMMDCASGASAERLRRIRREDGQSLLDNTIDFPHPDICDVWGSPNLGDSFRAPLRSAIPTLFITGTWDARTPPSNAEELLTGFPNGVHLVIEGGLHGGSLFLDSPRTLELMKQFLQGEPVSTTRISIPPPRFSYPTDSQSEKR